MSQRNLLSGRDRQLKELADAYEASLHEGHSFYADADDLADLADWYAMHQQGARAFEVEAYGLKLHPGNTALLVELSYLYLDDGQLEKAEETADLIEEASLPEVVILRANLLNERGKWEEADSQIDSIADKDDLYNIVEIAYAYVDSDRLDKAQVWIERGKTLYPDEPSLLCVVADYHVARGEWEEAARCYNTLIDTNPYSANYWHSLAKAYMGMNQPGQAVEACDYALVSEEQNGAIYLTQGMAYIELGNLEKANECFETAHRYGAVSLGFVRVQQGQTYLANGQWEEALQCFSEVLHNRLMQTDVVLSFCYLEVAFCLCMLQRDADLCDEYIHKAMQMHDDYEDMNLVLAAIIRMCQGQADQAKEYWSRALQYMSAPDLCYYTADLCLQYGLIPLAHQALQMLYQIDPDYENLKERMASLSLVVGDKAAFEQFNSLCSHPLSPHAADAIRSKVQAGCTPHEAYGYAMRLYLPLDDSSTEAPIQSYEP